MDDKEFCYEDIINRKFYVLYKNLGKISIILIFYTWKI